jgi:Ca-activated chloride channel family protein
MSNEDFENDNKDAGEIGAGQTITALYEIIPAGQSTEDQQIAVFDVRYKKALGTESILLTENVFEFIAPESDQKELSFAAGVAAFGMILRNSQYKGTADFDMAYELVGRGLENDPHGYRAELQELITTAKGIASK